RPRHLLAEGVPVELAGLAECRDEPQQRLAQEGDAEDAEGGVQRQLPVIVLLDPGEERAVHGAATGLFDNATRMIVRIPAAALTAVKPAASQLAPLNDAFKISRWTSGRRLPSVRARR